MRSIWIDKVITYDGTALRSRWIRETTGEAKDAIVSFIGPANVPITNMVDLEDVKNNAPIFSRAMLHFICEHFDGDLALAVARQRLLVAIAFEKLLDCGAKNLRRDGDDIFSGDMKLSVSIATSSPVSTLIHFAMNIQSQGTPVPALGLADIGIEPVSLAKKIMERYTAEISEMEWARAKVRPVN